MSAPVPKATLIEALAADARGFAGLWTAQSVSHTHTHLSAAAVTTYFVVGEIV